MHVVQRAREVGIRMALGARRREVLALFGRDTLRIALAGLTVGLVIATAAVGTATRFVPGIAAIDALSFLAVAVVLLGVALVAGLLPARRAARLDPTITLRAD